MDEVIGQFFFFFFARQKMKNPVTWISFPRQTTQGSKDTQETKKKKKIQPAL